LLCARHLWDMGRSGRASSPSNFKLRHCPAAGSSIFGKKTPHPMRSGAGAIRRRAPGRHITLMLCYYIYSTQPSCQLPRNQRGDSHKPTKKPRARGGSTAGQQRASGLGQELSALADRKHVLATNQSANPRGRPVGPIESARAISRHPRMIGRRREQIKHKRTCRRAVLRYGLIRICSP
jgi:hypothetical protein